MVKGAVRDLGKALGLPQDEVDQLAKFSRTGAAPGTWKGQMQKSPHFKDKIDDPVWRDLVRLAAELDGFPKYLGQHPGGMILSSTPLTDIVPVQRGAIEGRYVCQWDKDSIDDAGFVKIDFLALGALSQLQEAIELIKAAHRQKNRYVAHRFRRRGGLRHALQGRHHRHLPGGVGGPDADHHPAQTPEPCWTWPMKWGL